MSHRLRDGASRVASLLEQAGNQKLALAESCTGGNVASALVGVPGISRFFCGSAVTYRESAKIAWLGVPVADIERHSSVSQEITARMAAGLLGTLEEATIGAAITGHLGPQAPQELDGVIFSAIAVRKADGKVAVESCQCRTLVARSRSERIDEASAILLEHVAGWMAMQRAPAKHYAAGSWQ